MVCLLQKCYDLAKRGTPLLIKAAFCQDHLKVRAGGCCGVGCAEVRVLKVGSVG